MGLGEREALADKGPAVACSICLEIVAGDGDRSTARLHCGHEFHLDCIGSAFNVKGLMQCPNCRKVEKGNWLYANGSRSMPELSFDEWTHDEDLYDLSYTEMTFGVHWCPFSRLPRVPSSFEEGAPPPAFAWYHAMLSGNTATSLAADPGSFVAYLHSLQPSANSNSHSPDDSPTGHWNHASGNPGVQTHGWEYHPASYSLPSFRTSGPYQDATPSAIVPAVRVDLNGLAGGGSSVSPFITGPRSSSRLAGSFVSSLIPPYIPSTRPPGHVQDHYQHHNHSGLHGTVFTGVQRPGATSGLPPAPVGPTPPSIPDQTPYYLFPPAAPSSRSHQDVESSGDHHFYSWERDRFAPFPLHPVPVDREPGWWRPTPHSITSSDSSSSRPGLWHHNGPERPSTRGRTEASSYRQQPHVSRTRPYF